MYIARWNNVEIARSARAISLEGALYFPPDAVAEELLKPSTESSFCEWKGAHAEYFDIDLDDKINAGAVWRYPNLDNPSLMNIVGWYSFWRDVHVEWTGSGKPNVVELDYVLPNVAKALGVQEVQWRNRPPFFEESELFTGYLIPKLNIAVDVLADPGTDRREDVIADARARAKLCVEYSTKRLRAGEKGFGYIAVWGSTPPTEEAVKILQQGGSVIALGPDVEQIT